MINNLISEKNYNQYLKEIESLVDIDPTPGTAEFERLNLISMAVEAYEKNKFSFKVPSAIEFLKFRMEEMGLSQSDLIPYIGSKSKVSEILSGKRNLSLTMIKALNRYLDIPADVLLQGAEEDIDTRIASSSEIDLTKLPIREIVKRNWLPDFNLSKTNATEAISLFMKPLNGFMPATPLWRKSSVSFESNYSLLAWSIRVLTLASKQNVSKYNSDSIDISFLTDVAKLSRLEKGPILVKEFLNKNGIKFVILEHLPTTKLDGACFLDSKGSPIVALTLRYDRIDSFWHTLLHELAHVIRHLKGAVTTILDDLDNLEESNAIEKEADRMARDASIPREIWRRSPAYIEQTEESIIELADKLRIHPAIVAGRLRFELKNFKILNDMVGHGEIKKLFHEEAL